MKKLALGLLLSGAALAFVSALTNKPLIVTEAQAVGTAVMCQGDVSGASTGSRTIGGTNSAVPSQTLYVLNSAGCATILQADIGYFQSQGYTFIQGVSPIIFTTPASLTGTTDVVFGTLPAGQYIQQIIVQNNTASAVTGGLDIGSTALGTDIVSALTCAANCVASAPGTGTLAKPAFFQNNSGSTPVGTATTLHIVGHTSWNNAVVTVTAILGAF